MRRFDEKNSFYLDSIKTVNKCYNSVKQQKSGSYSIINNEFNKY